jgi:hypothetical protein
MDKLQFIILILQNNLPGRDFPVVDTVTRIA